jgi:hypothetical protein
MTTPTKQDKVRRGVWSILRARNDVATVKDAFKTAAPASPQPIRPIDAKSTRVLSPAPVIDDLPMRDA